MFPVVINVSGCDNALCTIVKYVSLFELHLYEALLLLTDMRKWTVVMLRGVIVDRCSMLYTVLNYIANSE